MVRGMFLSIVLLCAIVHGDNPPDNWMIPVRIHYKDKPAKVAWVYYPLAPFYDRNPEFMSPAGPIPGRNVFYINKLGEGDSLTISEQKYVLPDSLTCLIPMKISLDGVILIEDISSDTLQPDGTYRDPWVSAEAGAVLTTKSPVFTDIIRRSDYEAIHVYCYDQDFTKEKVRKLFAQGGEKNTVLQQAANELRILFIEEPTP